MLRDEISLLQNKLSTANTILEKNLDWMSRHLELQNDKIDVHHDTVKTRMDALQTETSKELVDHFSRLQNRFLFGVIATAAVAVCRYDSIIFATAPATATAPNRKRGFCPMRRIREAVADPLGYPLRIHNNLTSLPHWAEPPRLVHFASSLDWGFEWASGAG
jgi:hypothetical protein